MIEQRAGVQLRQESLLVVEQKPPKVDVCAAVIEHTICSPTLLMALAPHLGRRLPCCRPRIKYTE